MTALSIQPTYPIFTDIDGQPLENGYIFIGAANLNPQTNPINVYWDAALTIQATQPIRTLAGYPSNSGTPARLYVNSDYSIRVQNRNGSLVYSAPTATERYSDAVISGVNAEDVIYDPPFTGGVQTNVEAKLSESVSVFDFMTAGQIADVQAGTYTLDLTAPIEAALNSGASKIVFPEGSYRINAGFDLGDHPNVQDIIGEGNVNIKLFTSVSSMSIFYLPPAKQFVTIENLNLISNGTKTDGLFTYGILGTSFSYCWFNKISAYNFSGAGIECRQIVYVTVNDYVAQGCFYGLSNQVNAGYGSSVFTLNGAYITGCTRGITQTAGSMMSYNNFVLEFCGSNTTEDGALHLAGGGANCNNPYWEANYRNIVSHDGAFYLFAPYISTPGTAAPDVIDYTGTAFSDRGTLQINPTTIRVRNLLPDNLSNYDLTLGTNLVAPLAGGSVAFGNQTMAVANGSLTSATWTTVYTIPAAEVTGTAVNVLAMYEYTCYAGAADQSTGFDSGTIMNGTLRSYSGSTPAWLRLSSNLVQMNVTGSSYGLLYKIVMRRIYPG